MFAGVKKLARDLFTEDDAGTMFCPVRIFGSGGLATFVAHSSFMLIVQHTFDGLAFGGGFAAILGAMAVGVGAKAKLGGDTGG